MNEDNTHVPDLPKTSYSSTNLNPYGSMLGGSNFGMNPYSMYPGGMGSPFMGGPGMFMGNSHLPTGLQQSIGLLETVLVTIGSTTQLIESSYMAAKGIVHTFREINHQAKNIKEDFKNTIRSIVMFLKRVLMISRENRELNDKERRSIKRIFMVICLLLGVPYLCKKVVLSGVLNERSPLRSNDSINPEDAKFAKVLYSYTPQDRSKGELKIEKNQIIAILSETSITGTESLWWKARNKAGQVGYVPSNYLQVFDK